MCPLPGVIPFLRAPQLSKAVTPWTLSFGPCIVHGETGFPGGQRLQEGEGLPFQGHQSARCLAA